MPPHQGAYMFDNKLVKEIHDKIHEIDKRQVEMQKDIAQNTKDLSEHIEGVIQNRARIEELEEESTRTEERNNTLVKIVRIVVAAGSFCAIVFTAINKYF